MANVGGNVAKTFRDKFRVIHKETVQWFPGHMRKGLRQMQQKLKSIDCIIEVHDARLPLTGRLQEFRNTVSGLKPHILVLNKMDLADMSKESIIRKKLKAEGYDKIIFTNFKDQTCQGMKSLLPISVELIEQSNRYNRMTEIEYVTMIIGAPNVGKSSLINRLRNNYLHKGNATAVGNLAGVTRSVLTRIKINEKPLVYLLDTPGIYTPYVRDIYAGLKLALVGSLQDHLVGQEIIADYLLFWLNKQRKFEYVEKLGLKEPNDNIIDVLAMVALKMGRVKKIKNYDGQYIQRPDFVYAAEHFIRIFRTGELGRICLDEDIL
ncbi:mitochondrial GTPase 1 [Aphidius gifuensis]|uniref:mitochondrial GTPase 1 n=1 Tax=Aphidius gifuensis TaxID=684658 RepID=UPI001CDCC088|nr:mitochondrial GTPase 1 [Aphidius gifuensis]